MAKKGRERSGSKEAAASRTALSAPDSPDPVVLFARDGRILSANEAAHDAGTPTNGAGPAENVPPFWRSENGRTALLAAMREKRTVLNLEVRIPAETGARVYWVSARRTAPLADGRFIAVARDVTGKLDEVESTRARYEELLARADRDAATGLFTRDRFLHLLAGELHRSQEGGRPFGFLLIDLDQFRALNDALGAAAGDEALQLLGDALRTSSRWDGETFGRMGPDEVGVLLPNALREEALAEAERLVKVVAGVRVERGQRHANLAASVGVALFPSHGSTSAELVQAAYSAMEQAQAAGGARFRMHDPKDPERLRTVDIREQSMMIRDAIDEGRFVPFFQPVQEVATGRIVSAEALARLRLKDGTFLTPEHFLVAAERYGLVTPMDRLLIASTFDALVAAKIRLAPDFEIAINLSGIDFDDDKLVADISHLARRKGIRPDRVVFEITETAALRDLVRVQSFTAALVAEGFRFALDDFGIGFSSFRYLRELPVSVLKFDVSYVQNLPTQAENRVFVRGIAEICRGLGVKTVAEGVETAAILGILKELGVDRAQGYYIGRPAPELPDSRSSSGAFRKVTLP